MTTLTLPMDLLFLLYSRAHPIQSSSPPFRLPDNRFIHTRSTVDGDYHDLTRIMIFTISP